jgi:squalene cyclase
VSILAAEPPSRNDPEKTAAAMITPAADRAIDRGLAWLARRQHEDGSFGTGTYPGNTGITGLAGMAFLSSGSTPGRGPYGRPLNRCVDYLLQNAQQSGFINAPRGAGHGPMYGHGFATLFLAECDGMSLRPEVRETLAKAVKLIVATQNKEGGWRYFPQRDDADISVTICQMMALRAAHNAGLHVPKDTIDRSVQYVKRAQNADGGFRYMLEGTERESGFARSAAAVVALNGAGIYQGPEVEKALAYLMHFKPQPGVEQLVPYYEYGHYYAVQAMWQAGGDAWNAWYPAVRDDVINRQQADGSWKSSVCEDYSTAMYLMVLELPNNLLPIFQR